MMHPSARVRFIQITGSVRYGLYALDQEGRLWRLLQNESGWVPVLAPEVGGGK